MVAVDDVDDGNDDVVNAAGDNGGNKGGTESFGDNDEFQNMAYTKKVAMCSQGLNLHRLITFLSKS